MAAARALKPAGDSAEVVIALKALLDDTSESAEVRAAAVEGLARAPPIPIYVNKSLNYWTIRRPLRQLMQLFRNGRNESALSKHPLPVSRAAPPRTVASGEMTFAAEAAVVHVTGSLLRQKPLLSGADGHRQAVGGRGQGTDPAGIVGARRIVGLVEVEEDAAPAIARRRPPASPSGKRRKSLPFTVSNR